MKQYFKDLKLHEKLNPELNLKGKTKEELITFQNNLYYQWKNHGDEVAKNKLWASVLRIVYQDITKLIFKYKTNVEFNEVLAEANLSVFKSLESFDPSKNVSFTSWSRQRVFQSYMAYTGTYYSVINTPLKLKDTPENKTIKNVKVQDLTDFNDSIPFEEEYGNGLRAKGSNKLELMMDNNIFSQLKSVVPLREYEVLKGLCCGIKQSKMIELLTPETEKERKSLERTGKNNFHIKVTDSKGVVHEEIITVYAFRRKVNRNKGLLTNKLFKMNIKYQTVYTKNKVEVLRLKFWRKIKDFTVTNLQTKKEMRVLFKGKFAKAELKMNYGYAISKMDFTKLKAKTFQSVRDNLEVIENLKDFL